MAKKYRIWLSTEEREQLQNIVKAGKAAASKRQRAQILLAADANKESGELRDEDIAKVLDVSVATVERTRCALCEHGLEVAVHGWPPHRKVPRTKLDGWAEAHLVAAAARRFTLDLKAAGRPSGGSRAGGQCEPPDHWQSTKKMTPSPGR